MLRCETCQDRLLDHLYGLLDPADSAAVEEHLTGCEPCRAACEQAVRMQGLIGMAARFDFPDVVFKPPAATVPAAPAAPVVSPKAPAPVPPGTTVRRVWMNWVIAASLLLASAAILGPAVRDLAGFALYKPRVVEEYAAVRAAAVEKARLTAQVNELDQKAAARVEDARKVHDAVVERLLEAEQKVLAEARERPFVIDVRGPASAVPGAPNEYVIQVLDRNNTARPAAVDAKVKDASGKVLFEQSFPAGGPPERKLRLPASVWDGLRPGSDLNLQVSATDPGAGTTGEVREQIRLLEPVYTTYLVTDRPMYRPGETIYFRSLTLDRTRFLPPERDLNLQFRLHDPNGSPVQGLRVNGLSRPVTPVDAAGLQPVPGPDGMPVRGVGTGAFVLPVGLAGGEYTLRVYELPPDRPEPLPNALPLAERRFIVHKYTPDRLVKKLDFDARSYGPGDVVQARVELRDQAQPLPNVKVEWFIRVDGRQVSPEVADSVTNADGTAVVRVRLPAVPDIKSAILTVNFQRAGGNETLVRPIPIASRTLLVEFFPEGGDLVAGVPNRVYFRAATATGRPADVAGVLTDGTKTVCEVRTLTDAEQPGVNQGLGAFTFTPEAGKRYAVRLDRPIGSLHPVATPQSALLGVAAAHPLGGYVLPAAKRDGVVLTVPEGVTRPGEPFRVRLASAGKKRAVLVGAYTRGRPVAHERAVLEPGKPAEVVLNPGPTPLGGVTRITVFEEPEGNVPGRDDLKPVAERLVFRQPGEVLRLGVTTSKPGPYLPGERVELTLRSTDEAGRPKPAVLWAAVVNQSVIAMADEKSARSLPTHFLLGGEIRRPDDLEYADFLLTDHPKAAAALDLVLGTQGWRRFAEQAPGEFRARTRSEDADRLVLAMSGGGLPPSGWRSDVRRVFNEYWPQYQSAFQALQDAERDRLNRANSRDARDDLARANSEYTVRMSNLGAAAEDLDVFDKSAADRKAWLPGTTLLLFGLGICLGAARLVRREASERKALSFGAIGFLSIGAACLLTVYLTDLGNQEWRGTAANATRPNRFPNIGGSAITPPPSPTARGDMGAVAAAADGGAERMMMKAARVDQVDGPGIAPPGWDPRKPRDRIQPEFPDRAVRPLPALRPIEISPPQAVNPGTGLRAALAQLIQQSAEGGKVDRSVAEASNAIVELTPRVPPLVVREYAHTHYVTYDKNGNEVRNDFTETLLWQPVLVTPQDGLARVSFDLSEEVNGYQVLVAGHTLDGRLGAVTGTIEVRKPLAVDPKLPPEIGSADKIDLPVMLTNGTGTDRTAEFSLALQGLKPEGEPRTEGEANPSVDLPANGGARRLVRLIPQQTDGVAKVRVAAATTDGLTDAVDRSLTIVPDGFPAQGSHADLLEQSMTARLNLPPRWDAGSLRVTATVYPNTLAELQAGLAGLLREPYGCFEQSSTTNYPNVLITEYLRESDLTNPELSRRSRELMDRGYVKLTGYECPKTGAAARLGYEWFGAADRPHEALTAYGLLQFTDMSRVYPVDPEMLKRTRQFLLDSRDGAGGFRRNARALDSFGRAPDHVTNAYIVWALTEAERGAEDRADLAAELDALVGQTKDGEPARDPYFLALVANSLLNVGRQAAGVELLKTVAGLQAANGSVPGAATSITRSSGRDLLVETTAFAVLGWLKANRADLFLGPTQAAMKWVGSQRAGGGAFGSTQATILALKALVEFARTNRRPADSGEIRVLIGGREVGRKSFTTRDTDPVVIEVPNPDNLFPPGPAEVRIESTARQAFPATIAWSCRTRQPASSAECSLALGARLAEKTLTEGESVRLSVSVENRVDRAHGMAVAIVGIPAGLRLPEDMKQLRLLTDRPADGSEPTVAYWETRGRELILYWRGLRPRQTVELGLDLIADIPGEFRGPAGRAYLYYDADHKHWVEPLDVTIRPRTDGRAK